MDVNRKFAQFGRLYSGTNFSLMRISSPVTSPLSMSANCRLSVPVISSPKTNCLFRAQLVKSLPSCRLPISMAFSPYTPLSA